MTPARRLSTAGLGVNVRIEGAGPPLLFLGGSNFDLSIRAPVFDSELKRHFTVAAADPRGLGLTDAPDGEWTMQDFAQDALHLMDALGWTQADVLGESFGAMTALHLAALAPNRINRIALCAGAAGGAGGSSYPVHDFLHIPDADERARRALDILDCRFADRMTRAPEEAAGTIAARVKAEAEFLSRHNNMLGYPRLLAARANHDAWHLLPKIHAQTLIFAGRYDRQAPPDCAENIARAMPNTTLHIVEGGHSICFATPEPVATILRIWS